jgi:hypothetical protein
VGAREHLHPNEYSHYHQWTALTSQLHLTTEVCSWTLGNPYLTSLQAILNEKLTVVYINLKRMIGSNTEVGITVLPQVVERSNDFPKRREVKLFGFK